MKSTLRHITVWFLTLNLLIATMGLTVHSLYCICKDSFSVSVFEIESQCGQPIDDNLPSCCKAELAEKSCTENHDCEDKEAKYFKLATQFVINEISLNLQKPNLQVVKSDFIIIHDAVVAEVDGAYFNKPPPIRPFGKSLLPHIQSFLC